MQLTQTPQIEPITTLARDHKKVLSRLTKGPIFLAQRSQPTAVLVSIEQWDEIVKYVQELEAIAESERIVREIERDSSTLVSHDELKHKLVEKRAHVESEVYAGSK
jgi:prevent-host-death family protein